MKTVIHTFSIKYFAENEEKDGISAKLLNKVQCNMIEICHLSPETNSTRTKYFNRTYNLLYKIKCTIE